MSRFSRFQRFLLLGLGATVILQAVLWLMVSRFPSGSTPLVLRYRSTGEVDLLGSRETLYTLPALGALVLVVNAGLAWVFERRDKLLTLLLFIAAIAVQVALLVALAMLLVVNRP